jgi:hypothetical protein
MARVHAAALNSAFPSPRLATALPVGVRLTSSGRRALLQLRLDELGVHALPEHDRGAGMVSTWSGSRDGEHMVREQGW